MDPNAPDAALLIALVREKMPFGKYKGTVYAALPEAYLVWFQRQGFPPGKVGTLLATLYEIRLNGLEEILHTLKKKYST
ncbi:MAG: DUF3820 family protein [Nitritalea sp.]